MLLIMQAVILAGGFGSRISEESHLRPKPMIEIGGKPIIWHVMKIFAANGVSEFIICLGYRGYMIKEYFANYHLHASDITVDLSNGSIHYHQTNAEPWKVTLVETGDNAMTGGRIKAIGPYLKAGQPFCMTYGDGVANIDVIAEIEFHKAHGKMATIASVVPPGRYGALEVNGTEVKRFVEKPAGDNARINGGFFVLNPGVLDLIDGPDTPFEGKPLETLASRGDLHAFRHDGFWYAMDTLRDRNYLESLWASGNAPWKVW
jgi:glucose-1-phosphate cytidylyltransferase